MEASDGVIRGNVELLMKLVAALDAAGVELIAENAVSSSGGRGVRLKGRSRMTVTLALVCVTAWLAARRRGDRHRPQAAGTAIVYGASLAAALLALTAGVAQLLGAGAPVSITLPLGLPWLGAHFRLDALSAFFLFRRRPRRRGGEPVCARLRPA